MGYMIETEGLRKQFKVPRTRQVVEAVRGVDLQIAEGEVFGFLGPNGAGKTTTQRMLTTLIPPDAGRALVAGHDLLRAAAQVRKRIGAISQVGGADPLSTGRENLILQARLYGLSRSAAGERTRELIEMLQLSEFAGRIVSTYSGGQRRRLDLALGLVHKPVLLFMDEPSLGLDPQSRAHLWDEIRKLRADGTTIFLTTHYMDEADQLCDRLAIIDGGAIVAQGTPVQLKQQISGDIVTLGLENPAETHIQASALLREQAFVRDLRMDEKTLQVYVEDGEDALALVLQIVGAAQLQVRTVSLAHPSLEDVFLRQTGRSLREQSNGTHVS